MGLLARIPGLWFSPRETSADVVRDPKPWLALVAVVLLNLAFTVIWMQKVDPVEFMKIQNEESGALDKVEPDQRASIVETQAKAFPIFAWLGPVLFIPVILLVVSFLQWLIFRFGYSASALSFKQSLGIVGNVSMAVGVITTPLILLVLYLKGDWNMNPTEAIGANLALLLDKGSSAKWLYHLAASVDLFALWSMFLTAVGYGIAAKRPTSSAIWGVLAPYAAWVIAVAAWKAMF